MKKMKSLTLVIAMMVAFVSSSFAQHDHHHTGEAGKGPHQGTVQEADPYHMEILNKDGKLTFYLLDANAKPFSNKGITGTVVLQFADKTSATVTLTPLGDDGFSVPNDKASTFKSCVVTMKVDGKSVTVKFRSVTSTSTGATNSKSTYTCSMCGGDFEKAGTCPKCGMTLVEKTAAK